MQNCEEAKACKPEKSSSPAPDQTNIHVYPDWAAMQAYYGPGVAVPPYFNPAVASGHGPHPYMWVPPQHLMPPYGASYAAIYPHGGIYARPGVSLAPTPLSNDSPVKSSGNSDRGLMKKLKGIDGLAMSIGNGNADSAEDGTDHGISQSGEMEGSSEGSDGNTIGGGQNGRKRSREGTPNAAEVGKIETQSGQVPSGEANGASKMTGVTVTPARVSDKLAGTVLSAIPTTELELRNSPNANAKRTPITGQPCSMIPNEALLQNERELKRERRKQSNRESARRSRLRKQAEAEELAIKVESLTTENLTLKSKINRLTDNSEKLKLQNAKLMEKLKFVQEVKTEDSRSEKKGLTLSTANLLSRVDNNSGSVVRNDGEGEIYENNRNSGAKLRQLLDASPRADAVAAG